MKFHEEIDQLLAI